MLCNDLLTSCVTTTWVCKGYPLKRGGTASSPQSTPHEVPHGQATRARVIQRKQCSPPLLHCTASCSLLLPPELPVGRSWTVLYDVSGAFKRVGSKVSRNYHQTLAFLSVMV